MVYRMPEKVRSLRKKCPNTEFFLVRTRKNPYLDTFHAVVSNLKCVCLIKVLNSCVPTHHVR